MIKPVIQSYFYRFCPTPFGTAVILWNEDTGRPLIIRIILSKPGFPAEKTAAALYPFAFALTCPFINGISEQMIAFFSGEDINFSLDNIRLDMCSAFQQKALRAEHAISRGCVSSYSRIAEYIGHSGAGRAAGSALATNPFPVIIPCHRAIRSDGSPGDYQGGPAMKRKLLEMEGIRFDARGRVGEECYIY